MARQAESLNAAGTAPAQDKFAVSPPQITLPRGGGAIRGIGEKFGTNPVTGTANLSIPIATSPGRGGFGPDLSLSYDSGAGNGPFGLGWTIGVPSITRKTDKGLPRYRDEIESDVFILSDAEDLVPVIDPITGKLPNPPPQRTVGVDTFFVRQYRPRIEGLFALIERWTHTRSGETRWRSISKENVTTWFGSRDDARIADPSDPRRVFSWLISESFDDKGNVIRYSYEREDDRNVDRTRASERYRTREANRYIKRIQYGNTPSRLVEPNPDALTWHFEVVFDYGEHDSQRPTPDAAPGVTWPCRLDPFSTFRSGFEVRTYRLCRRVLMFHRFAELGTAPQLVRSTDFAYREVPDPTGDHAQDGLIASFISGVTHASYKADGGGSYLSQSLPPLEFTYSAARIQNDVRTVDAKSVENLPAGLRGTDYQWLDLDGEGISGVLTEDATGWFYKRNLSPLLSGNDPPGVAFAPVELVAEKPAVSLAAGWKLQDLAGDGRPHLAQFAGTTPGFYARTRTEGWDDFAPFRALPNVDWSDPNLRFVDLTGDGIPDVLITEHQALTWYPSLGETGFAPSERAVQALDEERGPRLVFDDGEEAVYVADMSGDGLGDLVRVRNGEVCYWPNVGYGRFGAKVTMDNAPWFDAPDQFSQRRIRLTDVDGSGLVDIIYLGAQGAVVYFNQSGNGWSGPRPIGELVGMDNVVDVQAVDLFGNGTACLVWSSPLPADARQPMRFVDLMGGTKPHLLLEIRNNLGKKTIIEYAASTRFYAEDRAAGRPWTTKLPFPVHVVVRTTTHDEWRQSAFSSTYSYHHGYFDGVEREFRGFGRVEHVDVESFGTFAGANAFSRYVTSDKTLYQPPVKTITWFHTGAALDGRRILSQFEAEYFPRSFAAVPSSRSMDAVFQEKQFSEPELPLNLNGDEWREALRACKGMTLRQEIYELDAAELAKGNHVPVRLFSAAGHNCSIQVLQRKGENRNGVFLVTESEALEYNYELDLRPVPSAADPTVPEELKPDPRVAHTLNLSFDELGNIQQVISVGYPRWRQYVNAALDVRQLALVRRVQDERHLAYTETRYTNDAIDPASGTAPIAYYRRRVACEELTYELTGVTPRAGTPYFAIGDLRRLDLSTKYAAHAPVQAVAMKRYHELPQNQQPTARLVDHTRTLFMKDDLSDARDFGELGRLGLVHERYKLAMTDGLLGAVFTGGLLDSSAPDGTAIRTNLRNPAVSGYVDGSRFYPPPQTAPAQAAQEYWIRSGVAGFAMDAADHFYLPEQFADAFDNPTLLQYDGSYDLFVRKSTDARGNVTTVERFDYRLLAAAEMSDRNDNRTETWFDVLGRAVAVAIKGKVTAAGATEADNLDGFDDALANPAVADTTAIFDAAAPSRTVARRLLGNATSRILYHFGETRDAGGTPTWNTRPPGSCTIVREKHVASLAAGDPPSPLQISLECSDGHGTVLMKRSQAEPETRGGSLRWIVSGKTVLNNKGKAVKQYEPYFSTSAGCRGERDAHEEAGVTPLLFYDAVGRLVRTEFPDGTVSRVEFSPWHFASFDANDAVADSQWYDERKPVSNASAAEKRAARLSLDHAGTAPITILDSLGREVVVIAHNTYTDSSGVPRDERYVTFTKLDAEGKALWVCDTRGNLVVQTIVPAKPNHTPFYDQPNPDYRAAYDVPLATVPAYDMTGALLYQRSMDGGDRWTVNDAAGQPLFAWDVNQKQDDATHAFVDERRRFATVYDDLRRPVEQWMAIAADPPKMIERLEYMDTDQPAPLSATDAKARNLCGQKYRHFDASGLVQTSRLDFQGNTLELERRMTLDYQSSVTDWQSTPTARLNPETFYQLTEYDALKRMTRLYNWHRLTGDRRVAIYEPEYNERGLLVREELIVRATRNTAVTGRRYDETGATRTYAIADTRYDAKGQKTLLRRGNGTTTRYDYDPVTLRLRQLRTTRLAGGQVEPPFPAFSSNLSDARVVQQLNYTYDAVGNIVEIYDEAYEPQFFRNQMVEPRSRFVYDALYRLVEATGREGANPATAPTAQEPIPQRVTFPVTNRTLRNYTQRYAYDAVGNIRRMRHIADQGDWHRRYDYFASNNRLMRTWEGDDDWNSGNANNKVSYDYDTHGNTRNLADVSPQFYLRWDHRDMLRRIELGAGRDVRYQYDSGKQRTRKVITDGGGRAERLYLGGLELFRRFVPGNAQPVEEIESLHVFEGDQRVLLVDDVVRAPPASPLSEGQLYRYQYGNHLGSVSLELNELAATISYEEFHPYGTMAYRAVVGAIETPGKRYRYVGMERDDESALGYHGARYVAPWMSRWVSADPSGIGDGLNLYCYSACDPVNNVDVNGRAVKPKEYLALPEALRRELENPPLLPPVITPILPPEGPTMSQGGPIDPRWATPQYQQEIRERAYYESHPLEALDRSAEQMQKRDVVRFISQFGTARNMPGYQGPTTLPGNYQRGAPTHQAMPRGPAKPAPVSPMTPPEPVAPAAPYQPELPVTIAPPKAPEPPPPAPAAPSQPPKVIIPPAPPQQKLLPPGGIPSQTLNQVRNLKGTNQERGAAAKERVRQMNQGGGERVTPTRAGKRQNDVAYDQPRSQTELQHEVKNYRVWITVEGEARLHEVELTPTLRQQAERNFWWRREGLRLGEDRLVQWDFVGAPPSQELAELLQFLKIPYVIHQRQQ